MKKILFILSLLLFLTGCTPLTSNKKYEYVNSVEELNGRTIGILEGSIYDEPTRALFDKTTKYTYCKSFNELLIYLEGGDIDGFVIDRQQAVLNGALKDDVKFIDQNIIDSNYAYIFSEKSKNIIDDFNDVLNDLKDQGYLEYLKHKWMTSNGKNHTCDKVETSTINSVLKVACNPDSEPFCFMSNGDIQGYEVDLLNKIASILGYKLEYHELQFIDVLKGVENNEYDIGLGSICMTSDRDRIFNFSDPTYYDYSVFLVRKDKANTISEFDYYSDLDGRSIGALRNSAFVTAINRELPNSEIKYYDSRTDIINALKNKEIDGYVVEEEFARQIEQLDSTITYFRTPIEFISTGFVFADNDTKLKDQFNEFLILANSNGLLEYLYEKWISINSYDLINDEVKLSNENGTLKVLTSPDSNPFSFEKNGKFHGYEVELFEAFCKEYGYDYQIESSNFNDSLNLTKENKADVAFNAFVINDNRNSDYNISNPTFSTSGVLVVRCK